MKKEQKVTIGSLNTGLAGQFSSISENIKQVESWLDGMSTEEYISTLIDRLNAEVNATGGYTYIVEGIGLRTYDVAVSDPAVGTEANAVVEMRGGTIRIANTKDAQGDWEWKTVFTSGHIAGELVTAAQIITGYIGSAGSTFIDLDNNIVQLGDTADNSITVSDAGISFNGLGGSTVGFIDSGNTMAVGYKRVESLTSEKVEDVKDGGTATIFMSGWEEPDFADGDLTISIRYNLGTWVPYTEGFTFSSYGTQQGTVFNAELIAANGSDPWKIVLSLGTSVALSSASVTINWWADGAAPRVAFGGDTTGDFGFAVNYLTQADGYASFAAGNRTQVTGGSSAAFGGGTRATGNYQFVMGKWNSPDSSKLFIVGNGTADNARSNALTVDEDGNIAAESINLWHGQRTLSSSDNIDQLYESGIFYLPGSVPSGTYPSGANGQYASLLSMGNNAEGSSTGWVGRQILVQGAGGVWHRTYAGSPRAWTTWQPLDESSHPTEIPASSLTLTGCSLNGTSTIPAYKIGRHVTINMRVNVTAANPTIAGFPATSGANSHIPVIAYRQSDNAAIAGYMTNAGVVTFPALASGSNIMLHVEYIASS